MRPLTPEQTIEFIGTFAVAAWVLILFYRWLVSASGPRFIKAKRIIFRLWLANFFLCAIIPLPASTPEPSRKARILLVTGIDYPGHHWQETTPALAQALRHDPRLDVRILEDPWLLDSAVLSSYDAVVLHFQNWEVPGPGPAARQNLEKFVAGGNGLVLVHFACGAWYGEWPGFEKLAGRVWFGSTPGVGKRQHDPFGPFTVEPTPREHPITRGLKTFTTTDELYTCLAGDHPVQVLAQAKSKVDGVYYPIALVSSCEKGRTFHCVLGHNAAALSVTGVQELYARGCAWAAGLELPSAP